MSLGDELTLARTRLGEAKSGKAKAALEGVILALRWVIEGADGTSPSEVAAGFKADPLDHDHDGTRGGSKRGKLATARKVETKAGKFVVAKK